MRNALNPSEVRERVNWLLNEIEKEFLKLCEGKDIDVIIFFASLEAKIVEKVKKAFEGIA